MASSADVKAQYGFVALLGKTIPEIGKLLKKAVKEKWTAERFSMSIVNTKWWRSTPSATREWVTLRITDPATARREMNAGAQDIRARARVLGVNAGSFSFLQSTWLKAKLAGYEGEALDAYIFKRTPRGSIEGRFKHSGGRYGQLLNDMLEQGYQYGYITTPDREDSPYQLTRIVSAANKIMSAGGTAQPAEWQQKMREFAATKYAAFADRINAGATVLDIAEPYRRSIAETLELNDADVGLNDKLLDKALQGRPAKDGTPQALALWEVEDMARKDGRWRKTDNAMQAAGETVDYIGRAFGFIA